MSHFYINSLIPENDPPVRVLTAYQKGTSSHDHDFYELVYVNDGFCLHETEGNVSLLLEGDLFIIKQGITHKYISDRTIKIYNCIFRKEVLGDRLDRLAALPGIDRLFSKSDKHNPPRLHLSLGERDIVVKTVEAMADDGTRRAKNWEKDIVDRLVLLLTTYSQVYTEHKADEHGSSPFLSYVAQALSYIEAHYSETSLNVGATAAYVGISPDYLSRQFKKAMDISAQEYIRRYRFARAMQLLQTDVPIGVIARQTGFDSISHFSREFKREMGITPSKYRTSEAQEKNPVKK